MYIYYRGVCIKSGFHATQEVVCRVTLTKLTTA